MTSTVCCSFGALSEAQGPSQLNSVPSRLITLKQTIKNKLFTLWHTVNTGLVPVVASPASEA